MFNRISIANFLRYTARFALLFLSGFTFILALISGSEEYLDRLQGIIHNFPNALPWLALLILSLITWKFEFVGGIILTAIGLGFVYFFNFSGSNFFWATFLLTLLIPILGSFFLVSHYLRQSVARWIPSATHWFAILIRPDFVWAVGTTHRLPAAQVCLPQFLIWLYFNYHFLWFNHILAVNCLILFLNKCFLSLSESNWYVRIN